MFKYIATKPVRLDRDYAVGEEIPAVAIDPKMEKRLIDWGKIQRVTTPDISDAEGEEQNQPQTNLFGGSLQESIKNVEALLGISYDDGTAPTLEERIKICKTRSAELNKPGTPDDRILGREPGIVYDGTQPPAGTQETTTDTTQGYGDIKPQDGAGNATGEDNTEASGRTAFTCEECGKVCGSKSALTSHLKTHNPS